MRAEALTRALRGRWHGSYGTARCPAHDDRSPSLSIKDGEDGRLLLYCHAGCAFPAITAALRDRGHVEQAALPASRDRRFASDRRPDHSLARLISLLWSQSRPIKGTLGDLYLRNRGIEIEPPSSLRFHPRLRHPSGTWMPGMVARVEHVRAGFIGLHRTFLDATMAKKTSLNPEKAMLGPCKGGAVRLRNGRGGLAVVEGIETGLSLASGLDDDVAVWAALSTSGMAALELPSQAEFAGRLLIGADGDPAGRRAAHALADRAAARGWSVEIASAPAGEDFNDVVRSARHD